jgi:hypothetical protein
MRKMQEHIDETPIDNRSRSRQQVALRQYYEREFALHLQRLESYRNTAESECDIRARSIQSTEENIQDINFQKIASEAQRIHNMEFIAKQQIEEKMNIHERRRRNDNVGIAYVTRCAEASTRQFEEQTKDTLNIQNAIEQTITLEQRIEEYPKQHRCKDQQHSLSKPIDITMTGRTRSIIW